MYTLQGTIYQVGQPKQISETFTVQEFVVKQENVTQTGATYYNYVKMQTSNQVVMDRLPNLHVGAEVEVRFSLKGIISNKDNKVYTNINAYAIAPLATNQPQPIPVQQPQPQQQRQFQPQPIQSAYQQQPQQQQQDADELPF